MTPVHISTFADAEQWIYNDHTLCCTHKGGLVSLFDPYNSRRWIDMATLLSLSYSNETYKLKLQQLLYYNQPLLVLASTKRMQRAQGSPSTVFHVFDTVQQTFLAAMEPPTFLNMFAQDMFARASNGFVVIGMSLPVSGCCCPIWYVRGYDVDADSWTERWIKLPDAIGPQLERTTAFEAFDGYFYALSTKPRWLGHCNEMVGAAAEQSTHYSGVRIPLSLQEFDAVMESFTVPRAPCLDANGIRTCGFHFRIFRDDTGQLKAVEGRLVLDNSNGGTR